MEAWKDEEKESVKIKEGNMREVTGMRDEDVLRGGEAVVEMCRSEEREESECRHKDKRGKCL